jgi:hypothetical protein
VQEAERGAAMLKPAQACSHPEEEAQWSHLSPPHYTAMGMPHE